MYMYIRTWCIHVYSMNLMQAIMQTRALCVCLWRQTSLHARTTRFIHRAICIYVCTTHICLQKVLNTFTHGNETNAVFTWQQTCLQHVKHAVCVITRYCTYGYIYMYIHTCTCTSYISLHTDSTLKQTCVHMATNALATHVSHVRIFIITSIWSVLYLSMGTYMYILHHYKHRFNFKNSLVAKN